MKVPYLALVLASIGLPLVVLLGLVFALRCSFGAIAMLDLW
jgi:hypothetical protein